MKVVEKITYRQKDGKLCEMVICTRDFFVFSLEYPPEVGCLPTGHRHIL